MASYISATAWLQVLSAPPRLPTCVLACLPAFFGLFWRQHATGTPSLDFRHPSTKTKTLPQLVRGYVAEGTSLGPMHETRPYWKFRPKSKIRDYCTKVAQLSTDAVSALRKVWAVVRDCGSNVTAEVRSCVKFTVAVLFFQALISLMVPVDVKRHWINQIQSSITYVEAARARRMRPR